MLPYHSILFPCLLKRPRVRRSDFSILDLYYGSIYLVFFGVQYLVVCDFALAYSLNWLTDWLPIGKKIAAHSACDMLSLYQYLNLCIHYENTRMQCTEFFTQKMFKHETVLYIFLLKTLIVGTG